MQLLYMQLDQHQRALFLLKDIIEADFLHAQTLKVLLIEMFDQHQEGEGVYYVKPSLQRVFYNFLTSSGLRWDHFTLMNKDSH